MSGINTFATLVLSLAGLIVIVAAVYWSFKLGKSKAEEERIRPFKEAADGWERVAKQQAQELTIVQRELSEVKEDHRSLKTKYEELERDYISASRTNMRLQGEVDQLKVKVKELEDLKELFTDAIREAKNSSR
jgi:archaellum component FlaC